MTKTSSMLSLYSCFVRRRRIGHCDFFEIWDLLFGISYNPEGL